MQIFHLAKRFFGAISQHQPADAEIRLVHEILLPKEFELWTQMSAMDRRHSLVIHARFVKIFPQANIEQQRAALLHDIGKLQSQLGVVARVIATIIGPRTKRFRDYHDHEQIGAQMLRNIASNQTTHRMVLGEVGESSDDHQALEALNRADDI